MTRILSIGTVVVLPAIIVAVLIKSLSTFEGGPHNGIRPIPKEAVPLWQANEIHWLVRYFVGYLYGAVPASTITFCPTVVDWDNEVEAQSAQECMKRCRSVENVESPIVLSSYFDEETIFIDRPGDEGVDTNPLQVTLLKKQNSQQSETKAPLILYMHGGAFITRLSRKLFPARIFAELLKLDDENSSVMESATFAIVDYRLAPEYAYPAATDDCLLALNHLVQHMGFGGGGIHVAGTSAGATLAMEVTLKSLGIVDTFYVDEPVVAFPTKDNKWTLDSPSMRRYAYSRMPPVSLIEWGVKAYTGVETVPEVEIRLPLGTVSTSIDITGGAMTVSEWIERSDASSPLPRLILVTAMGDPLLDAGLAFKKVYEDAIIRGMEEYYPTAKNEAVSKVKHFDTYSGHCGFYLFEPSVFRLIMKEWYEEMHNVWVRKTML